MGRIAELFEKKANGTITEEEAKELEQLQKEAQAMAAQKQEEGSGEGQGTGDSGEGNGSGDGEGNAEEEVDKLAQRFADGVQGAFGGFSSKLDKIVSVMEANANPAVVTSQGKNTGYIFDSKLGKKVSVAELADTKIALPERKQAGKRVQEISMKTVYFLQALAQKNVEKLQLLSEGTAADGGYGKLALV